MNAHLESHQLYGEQDKLVPSTWLCQCIPLSRVLYRSVQDWRPSLSDWQQSYSTTSGMWTRHWRCRHLRTILEADQSENDSRRVSCEHRCIFSQLFRSPNPVPRSMCLHLPALRADSQRNWRFLPQHNHLLVSWGAMYAYRKPERRNRQEWWCLTS